MQRRQGKGARAQNLLSEEGVDACPRRDLRGPDARESIADPHSRQKQICPLSSSTVKVTRSWGLAPDTKEENPSSWIDALSDSAVRTVVRSLAALPVVLFRTDKNGIFRLSAGSALRRIGLREGEAVGQDAFAMFPQVREEFERALAQGEGQYFSEGAHGGERWAFATHLAHDPETDGAIGISIDISAIKQLEERLKESEARFRALSDAAQEGILLHDGGIIFEANEAAQRMLGARREDLVLSSLLEVVSDRSTDEVRRRIAAFDPTPYRCYLKRKDGFEFPAEVRSRKVPYRGRTLRVVLARDLSLEDQSKQLAIDNLELRQASLVDGLTGLGNRKLFEERFTKRVQEALNRGLELSVLMLDIDHFKSINDRYGHSSGDAVLRRLGDLLKGLRTSDDVARIGGEEFCILLSGVEKDQAMAIAERIRRGVSEASFQVQGDESTSISTTISIGVASIADGPTPSEVFHAADLALYRAKSGGRNRVAS